jgi:hypothetical protein
MYTDYVNIDDGIPLTLVFPWCIISDTGTADGWLTTRRQRSETRHLTARAASAGWSRRCCAHMRRQAAG